jgi:hypothetical protein
LPKKEALPVPYSAEDVMILAGAKLVKVPFISDKVEVVPLLVSAASFSVPVPVYSSIGTTAGASANTL